MKIIYYIVSGVFMDLLQFLTSFIQNGGLEKFAPLIQSLLSGNFDLSKILSSLDLSSIAPIISQFMQKNNGATVSSVEPLGLKPIMNVADQQIVYTLNQYFYSFS